MLVKVAVVLGLLNGATTRRESGVGIESGLEKGGRDGCQLADGEEVARRAVRCV